MSSEYRLVERDGVDTLHRWPATERCNLGDTDADRALTVEEGQGWNLVTGGTAHACEHCFPLAGKVG